MVLSSSGFKRLLFATFHFGWFSLLAGQGLTEITKETGLDFVHFNGMTGQYAINEVIGSGAALFDYDGDGDLDLYLIQGGMFHGQDPGKALFPPKPGMAVMDRLYRNDLKIDADGKRSLQFTDVTEQSKIRETGYGMGVAAGDFDGDGFIDLYVTNYGPDKLWRNEGNGTFRDVTAAAGPFSSEWSTSAAFFDYDRDGDLDLYVCNYLDYRLENRTRCVGSDGKEDYCGPKTYDAVPDRLYQNQGNGTFKDVTTQMGIHKAFGAALGVVAADFNHDGWLDLFVANDGSANQLWVNQAGRGFTDEGLLAGCALNSAGNPEASMGVAVGDYDDDGDQDLFVTHLTKETNTLYVNDGNGWFEDRTIASGLAGPSTAFTAFGTGWIDLDNNGYLDLIALNGTVQVIETLRNSGDPYPLHQPNQVFLNKGNGKFEDASASFGTVITRSEVSRGAAFGDIDNDGDVDFIITNNNGPARLVRNDTGAKRPWLGVELKNAKGHAVAHAAVLLTTQKGKKLWRWSQPDGSYLCSSDVRVVIGYPADDAPKMLTVYWPDGKGESFPVTKEKIYLSVKQGAGSQIANPDKP